MLDVDQGANFIGAGLGVKPISTPAYVLVKNKGNIKHLEHIKNDFNTNYTKLETYVKGLPSTYEYLRDNIYKESDAD